MVTVRNDSTSTQRATNLAYLWISGLLILSGCQVPWLGSSLLARGQAKDDSLAASSESAATDENSQLAGATTGRTQVFAPPEAMTPASALLAHDVAGANSSGTSATSLADVAGRIQHIAATNPAAHEKLMQQLGQARPELWPLIVEQFHAALALRDELADQQPDNSHSQPTLGGQAHHLPSRPTYSEIGNLLDPRPIRREISAADQFADVTPAAMTAPNLQARTREIELMLAQQQAAARRRQAFDAHSQHPSSSVELAGGVGSDQTLSAARRAFAEDVDDSARPGSTPASFASQLPSQRPLPRNVADDPLVAQLVSRLAENAPTNPQNSSDVLQHARLRMAQLAAGLPADAVEPIPGLPPNEQDFWSKQMFALATYIDADNQADSKRRAAAAAIHLDEALGRLRDMSSLSVRGLAFCTKVMDFGAYEAYSDYRFAKGQQVLLYAEVENFRSREGDDGYHTSLASSYEILNQQGERVDGGKFPDVEDECRRRRRDFHIQYGLNLPERISSGSYRLQLIIQDNLSDKIGRNTIEFFID